MKNLPDQFKTNKPGAILVISGVLLFLLSYPLENRTADLHFYDTFYVISLDTIFFAHSIQLIFIGTLIILTRKWISGKKSIMWTILTPIATGGACFALWKNYLLLSNRPARYIDFAPNEDIERFEELNLLYISCRGILFVIQLLFILNIIFRMAKRSNPVAEAVKRGRSNAFKTRDFNRRLTVNHIQYGHF